jgi:imidazolonepropionase-like amidohydrolase
MRYAIQVFIYSVMLCSCAAQAPKTASSAGGTAQTAASVPTDPFPSTYQATASPSVLIRGATVLTGTGERIENADVLLAEGKIAGVGPNLAAPEGARIVEAQGRWVTPGIIDVHSHLGVYASPGVNASSDGNEATSPVTAEVWAEHSVWPQDPGFQTALEGGVTTLEILPGSANLIGGRGVTLKNVAATSYQAMRFPDAPRSLKMACGENPKGTYGDKGEAPSTRMGNVAGYRQAFADAQDYQRSWREYRRKLEDYETKKSTDEDAEPPSQPKRDLKLETLVEVLEGRVRVQMHCYRADEMMTMLDVAKEFGFRISAFHHGVEAYKIADQLAAQGVCAALWADWWGFKMEALDGIQENLALVDRPAGSCAIVHSDSEEGIQRLNQEAAKVMVRGERVGLKLPPERVIRWLTANPAKALGIADRVGTLEPGKMADVVVWNRDPFSVYALAEKVFIDGAPVYDREHPAPRPRSDFLLGQPGAEIAQ